MLTTLRIHYDINTFHLALQKPQVIIKLDECTDGEFITQGSEDELLNH